MTTLDVPRTHAVRPLPAITQERMLRTPIPGPRSQQLSARRDVVVASGVGTTLPVFIGRGSVPPCHAAGVVTLTCGTDGNVLRFLPPLVITDALRADALNVFAAAVAS